MGRFWKAISPFVWLAVFGLCASGAGYHHGREAGFQEGAQAMKLAIFGAIERINRESRS